MLAPAVRTASTPARIRLSQISGSICASVLKKAPRGGGLRRRARPRFAVCDRPGTSPQYVPALLLSFGNFDSRRDTGRSLFSVGDLQRGTALPGEALHGLLRAADLSRVVIHERHFWLVAGSFDGDDFLFCIDFRECSGKSFLGLRRLAGHRHDNEEQHSNAGCTYGE